MIKYLKSEDESYIKALILQGDEIIELQSIPLNDYFYLLWEIGFITQECEIEETSEYDMLDVYFHYKFKHVEFGIYELSGSLINGEYILARLQEEL